LERNNVEEALQAVDSLWDLDLLGLAGLELLVIGVTDDDGPARASDNYEMLVKIHETCWL
jgi:hypothetical protein